MWFLLQGQSGLAGGEGTALPLLHPITDGHLSLVTRARCGVLTAPGDSRGQEQLTGVSSAMTKQVLNVL